MTIVDRGEGTAVVLIPGIQGRWEYLRPAVDALAGVCRVITFSLSGDDRDVPPVASRGFDSYADRTAHALDRCQVSRAVICGVSFGALAAIRFGAVHPDRTSALVLASPPGPRWRMSRRQRVYLSAPRLLGPLFLAETPWRLRRELLAALPTLGERLRFSAWQLRTLVGSPISMDHLAERARLLLAPDLSADCGRIEAPTLLVTGEPALDRITPVDGSLEYLRLVPRAHHALLERTGHVGSITRPHAFAALVGRFIEDVARSASAA